MTNYEIIETDEGLSVVEMLAGQSPEAAAEQHGGVLVDPGPYSSYEEAYDAMELYDDEDDEGNSG